MKIVVTGATGFIGRHVVRQLVHRGLVPTAVGRNKEKLHDLYVNLGVQTICADFQADQNNWYTMLNEPDVLLHLAWDELNDFNSLAHIERVLPSHVEFLRGG